MDLHTCVIVLRNQKVITSKSVDHSIGIIERDSGNEISEIQINATDGVNIRTYHYNNVEESLESLMNLCSSTLDTPFSLVIVKAMSTAPCALFFAF